MKYNTVDKENTKWKNLPSLPHTEDEEFVGWFLVNNPAVQIYNGNVMVPGYTTLFPKWGKHNFKEVGKEDPTCTASGWNSYHYCINKNCDYTTKVELPALGHSLIKHEIAEATCITKGYREVCWECTRCREYFSDERAENTISEERLKEIIIESAGHKDDGKGYYKDDDYHWLICKVCGAEFNINRNGKEGHKYGDWYDSEDGSHREHKCTVCSHIERTDIVHSWEKVDKTDSTCTQKGHLEYWWCSKHSGEYALSDNPDSKDILNWTELHKKVDKDLLPHSLSDWINTDGDNHWKECSVCHQHFNTAEHVFEYIFTQDGERNFVVKRTCTVCGGKGESKSEDKSVFDISASFGNVKIVKGEGNTWTLSYYGNSAECHWENEQGERIIDGAEPFTITYTSEGEGEFKVFCYAYNSRNELIEIAFALLTAY